MALQRRIGLILDESRYQRVATAARLRETSITAVIQQAIDRALPDQGEPDGRDSDAVLLDEPTLLAATADDLRATTVEAHRLRGI
jgi:hypothetical protein